MNEKKLTIAEESALGIFFSQYEVALNAPHAAKEIQVGIDFKMADVMFWPADDYYRKGRRVLGSLIRKGFVRYDVGRKAYDITSDGLKVCTDVFGEPAYYGNLMEGIEMIIGSQSFQMPAERFDENSA